MERQIPLLRLSAWFVLGIIAFLPRPGHTDTIDSGQSAIQAEYVQMNAAFVRHDLDDVMSYFTPNYTATDSKGQTETLQQTRLQYEDELKQMTTMQSHYRVVSCTHVPAGIEIEIRAHSDGTGVKHVFFATLKGSFTNDLWVRDLWVQTPQGWRLRHRLIFQDDTHTRL